MGHSAGPPERRVAAAIPRACYPATPPQAAPGEGTEDSRRRCQFVRNQSAGVGLLLRFSRTDGTKTDLPRRHVSRPGRTNACSGVGAVATRRREREVLVKIGRSESAIAASHKHVDLASPLEAAAQGCASRTRCDQLAVDLLGEPTLHFAGLGARTRFLGSGGGARKDVGLSGAPRRRAEDDGELAHPRRFRVSPSLIARCRAEAREERLQPTMQVIEGAARSVPGCASAPSAVRGVECEALVRARHLASHVEQKSEKVVSERDELAPPKTPRPRRW